MPVGTKVVEVAPTGRRIRRLPVASRQIRRPLSRIRCLRARGGLLPVLGAALCVVAADSCRGEGGWPDPLGLPSTMVPAAAVPPGACAAGTDEGYAASPFFMVGAAAATGGCDGTVKLKL